MKILLVGSKWMGGWTEGVESSIHDLRQDLTVFYYDLPNAPTTAVNRMWVIRYLPESLHKYFLPPAHRLGRAWEQHMNERLLSTVHATRPDLVLLLKGEIIDSKSLNGIRSSGSRIASWWVDNPIAYLESHPQVAAQFEYADSFFVFDRGRINEIRSMGAKHVNYLPCGFDPNIYHIRKVTVSNLKRFQCDVGFVASYYPERGKLLASMKGLDVAIWGGGWKSTIEMRGFPRRTFRGKQLTGPEIATMYGIARICPNVHHSQTLVGGLNMRTFEIPAAGGFQLVDDVPGLEELFDVRKEIVVYKSPEHFRELADYYLSHPSERTAIIERGRERVLRDHTYRNRLQFVFDTLERI